MFSGHGDEPERGGAALSSQPEPWISPEQYLEADRRPESRKSEYLNGRVFPVTGASRKHNLIVVNIVSGLHAQLKARPLEVYPPDMRVRVTETGLYAYPDVTVVSGSAQLADERSDVLLNPAVVFEVLSASTQGRDRLWKAEHYRRLPSLQEHCFVVQDEPRIERYRRQSDREWLLTDVTGIGESLELGSIQCVLPLAEIYDRVL